MSNVIGTATGGVSVKIILDPAAMNFMLRSPGGMVGKFILSLATKTVARAKIIAPVRTARSPEEASRSGVLRSSIGILDFTPTFQGMQARVAVNVSYALPVHYGVAGGVKIRPKNSNKVLRFPGKAGAIVFRPETTQKANAPNPFFWKALMEVLVTDPRVRKILSSTFDPGTPL